MNLKVTVRYTYEDFIALNKISQKNFHKFRNRIFKPFSVIVGALLAIMSVLLLLDGGGLEWYFYLALGIFLVLYNLFLETYIGAYRTKKTMQNETIEVEYLFEEDSFTQTSSQGISQRPYDTIYKVFNCKEHIFIFFDKKHSIILPKRCFNQVELRDFINFIETKSKN